ncbi:unnamed protein product [Clavelina lepadiformis]|uniref:Fatty acyl-CoA reductase n=1 Tax=Clavelina lepadiformis TaxID=159417 RepID=A0ABP0EXI5_CLALP
MKTEQKANYPLMEKYFARKTIAMTGGTGFLGQGLIEKLLRCCPDVKKIILLIRSKRNSNPEERLEALTKSSAFDTLREINPKFAEKLSFVSCNLEADELGLAQKDQEMLQDEVDIFVHGAATLKFNEHLRLSFEINTKCVRKVLQLCKKMTHLQSVVHISTAYAYCNQEETDEKFYDCGVDYNDLESSLRWMSDDVVTKVTPDLIGKRPNTYTLTKALAEDLIRRESGSLPICICRPSMIIPAIQEPSPGWCNNVYGPTAFVVAYQKGFMKAVMADLDIICDLIPLDYVVNGVLAAAMKTGTDFMDERKERNFSTGSESDSDFFTDGVDSEKDFAPCPLDDAKRIIPIYTFNTATQNPLVLHEIQVGVDHWLKEFPSKPIRLPSMSYHENELSYKMKVLLHQTIPFHVMDAISGIMNKKQRMVTLNKKLQAGMEVMRFFFTTSFRFGNENALNLLNCLDPDDKVIYNYDARQFDWFNYMKCYVVGTQKYILKEDNHSEHKKVIKRLKALNTFLNTSAVVGTLGLATSTGLTSTLFDMATYVWDTVGAVLV